MFNCYNKSVRLFSVFALCMSLFFLSGCGKDVSRGKPAIQINDYMMTPEEFNEKFTELNIYSYRPEAKKVFLDTLINQKIILQEAQRLGLDKQDDFLKSIEKFWEQSLLKIIITDKSAEISKKVTVSDAEVAASYKRWKEKNSGDTRPYVKMQEVLKKQLIKEKQSSIFNTWVEGLKARSTVMVDEKALGI